MRYLFFVLLFFSHLVLAQDWEVNADSLRNERDLQTTIAEGNVVIEQQLAEGRRRLEADKVIYNSKDDLVTAVGSVRMWDEHENFYEADYIEISGDFKHAIIEGLELQLRNAGKLRSASAKREEHISTFTSPAYSACRVCKDNLDKPLLWELKAGRVVHNENEQLLKYYNAHLLFNGLPIFYMPYFQHPDPTVSRKSGFLLPSFGSNRDIGSFVSVPYFITLGDYADLTLNPIFTTEGGQIASGSFRHNFSRASWRGEASYTEAERTKGEITNARFDKNSNRWHVDLSGNFELDDYWSGGFTFNRASDRNYFRRYTFWGQRGNFLQSKLFLERLDDRDYFNITGYSFQDLRLNVGRAGESPGIFPNVDSYFYGDVDSYGGIWSIYSNLRLLDKSKLVDDRRIYTRGSYELPYYFDNGSVIRGNFNLYGLGKSSDFASAENSFSVAVEDEDFVRGIPQAGFVLSHPLRRSVFGSAQIIEPVLAGYASTNGANKRGGDNRDSNVYALDSHNIFLPHRLNGVDRFDSGQRIAYGVKGGHYANNMNIRSFIGQSYEFSEDEVLRSELGITEGSSPIVLAALANVETDSFFGTLNFDNQFQLDNSNYDVVRAFIQASVGDDDFRFHSNYLFRRGSHLDPSNRTANNRIVEQEQISFTAEKSLSKHWRGSLTATFDWGERPLSTSQTRNYGSTLTYDDECFNFNITGSRDFSRNPDLKDGYSVILNFGLKTLTNLATKPAGNLSGF